MVLKGRKLKTVPLARILGGGGGGTPHNDLYGGYLFQASDISKIREFMS